MPTTVHDSIMPTLFVSHGTPFLALDEKKGNDYTKWGVLIPRPKAILVFSAHWESPHLMLGETITHNPLIYDFFGFPEKLYELQYPAPGSTWLADKVQQILGNDSIKRTNRGLDHGVWIPLLHMWPQADIPILQISLPTNYSNESLFKLGKQLASLRKQGILIIASGMITHNLSQWDQQYHGGPVDWAKAFDDWVEKILLRADVDQLLEWQTRAPSAKQNHPTTEHFSGLLIVAGASNMGKVSFPITGFEAGIFS